MLRLLPHCGTSPHFIQEVFLPETGNILLSLGKSGMFGMTEGEWLVNSLLPLDNRLSVDLELVAGGDTDRYSLARIGACCEVETQRTYPDAKTSHKAILVISGTQK